MARLEASDWPPRPRNRCAGLHRVRRRPGDDGPCGGARAPIGRRDSRFTVRMSLVDRLQVLYTVALSVPVVVACQSSRPASGDSSSGLAATATTKTVASPPLDSMQDPATCGTLRDVAVSDVVRLDNDVLYFADETRGLALIDVRDPDRPNVRGNVPYVGTPIRLFVREGVAWLTILDWDRGENGPITIVRAIDVRDVANPRLIGDVRRDGAARDAQLVAGVLYVLSEHEVESFAVVKGRLERLDGVKLRGQSVQLAASSAGLATSSVVGDEVVLTWFDLPMQGGGGLVPRTSVKVPGGLPLRTASRVADVDDGAEVHLVTCAQPSCTGDVGSVLHVIDMSGNTTKASRPVTLFGQGGYPVVRAIDGRLVVALPSGPRDVSQLRTVDFAKGAARVSRPIVLQGAVASLAPGREGVLAFGALATPGSSTRVVLNDVAIDTKGEPRLRGSAAFGADWTSSTALDAAEAIAFDPIANLVAVPFAVFESAPVRWGAGAQLFSLSSRAPTLASTFPAKGNVDRAVFVRGRLVIVGAEEVRAIDLATSMGESEVHEVR